MARSPVFPAGTLLAIQAAGIHPASPFQIQLRTLDAPGRTASSCRVLVLPPGRPELGLPGGRLCLLRVERGEERRAARARQAAVCRKLVRRAAGIELGQESAVADVYATFFDPARGWFGTLGEWIDGRFWRLETDDRLFDRPRPSSRPEHDDPSRFRTEYDAKRLFMARLVSLLRKTGAIGWARRYEWSTWISQRKVLKRMDADGDPHAGWTSMDFAEAEIYIPALRQYAERQADRFKDLRPLLRELETGPLPASGSVSAHIPETAPASLKKEGAGLFRSLIRKAVFSAHMLFRPELRSARLMEEVQDGLNNGMLTAAEAERIRGQIHDPMLQTYLTCLAVHIAMLPITNLSVLAAAVWYSLTRNLSFAEGARWAALGLAFFAVAPMSPGSLARGLFVLGVIWRRRSFRRLRIALAFSFWRYVGYMAFPLQMVGSFPALARYMAARWATHAVRCIPAYGRPGGLLEHRAFDLAFNLPLTLARWWRQRRAP